jgi:calcineurin-like phosphoesterase family protein
MFSFLFRESLWGFQNESSHKVLSNNKVNYNNSDLTFSVASHIYEDLSSFDSLSYYTINNKLDALFILGDAGSSLNNKMVEQIDDLPYELFLIPGNNDISNDKEYNEFIKSWGNYRVIQKKKYAFFITQFYGMQREHLSA